MRQAPDSSGPGWNAGRPVHLCINTLDQLLLIDDKEITEESTGREGLTGVEEQTSRILVLYQETKERRGKFHIGGPYSGSLWQKRLPGVSSSYLLVSMRIMEEGILGNSDRCLCP